VNKTRRLKRHTETVGELGILGHEEISQLSRPECRGIQSASLEQVRKNGHVPACTSFAFEELISTPRELSTTLLLLSACLCSFDAEIRKCLR